MIITHDHRDHLDPETIGPYAHKETTLFVAPRFACRKLQELGVPEENIVKIDQGETQTVKRTRITGVYAIPTDPGVLDTCGYRVEFANGRSLYHTSDTGYSDLLKKGVPQAEIFLACINGKLGNMDVMEAAGLVDTVDPDTARPNHYDMFALNSENPETFVWAVKRLNARREVEVLEVMKPFVWGS